MIDLSQHILFNQFWWYININLYHTDILYNSKMFTILNNDIIITWKLFYFYVFNFEDCILIFIYRIITLFSIYFNYKSIYTSDITVVVSEIKP